VSRVSQNNVESHPFQSRHELPFGSFRIELVEVIAAFLVVDRSVAQNVKRDDEQLMRGGDNGFLLALAGRAAIELGGQKAIAFVGHSPCRLHQGAAQPAVALVGPTTSSFAAALVVSGS
jgi:hypothetical protein